MLSDVVLAAASEPVPDAVIRAQELLDLLESPTSIATVILLGFAQSQLSRNARGVDVPRTRWAGVAAALAFVIAAAIVVVMTPLAYRMLFVNRGRVETVLLVYGLSYLVAIGTAAYAAWVAWRIREDFVQ